MRACDRDLIRGGHYGQRSCEPHSKAEHMAAPTKAANVKKALANSEPSTHDTKQSSASQLAHMIGCVARLAGSRHLMKGPVDIALGISGRCNRCILQHDDD